jgi:hypothetical protein
MDHQCLAFIGQYGYRHELIRCENCHRDYCSCLDILEYCRNCKNIHCVECIALSGSLQTLPVCDCIICNDCSSDTFYEHGTICSKFRNIIKLCLYQHPIFNVDIIDYIASLLWNREQD